MAAKERGIIFAAFVLVLGISAISASAQLGNATDAEQQVAATAILEAEKAIQAMNQSGFGLAYVSDKLLEAKDAFTLGRYSKVLTLAQIIEERKERAVELSDLIRAAELKAQEYKQLGVDTSEAEVLIASAREAFQNDRYSEVDSTLAEIDKNLEAKRAELALLGIIQRSSRTFFQLYGRHLVVIAAIALAAGVALWKLTERQRIRSKIKHLKAERATIEDLMEKAQLERFKEKTLSAAVYQIRMEEYRKRLNEIKTKLPVYEALAKGKKLKGEQKLE